MAFWNRLFGGGSDAPLTPIEELAVTLRTRTLQTTLDSVKALHDLLPPPGQDADEVGPWPQLWREFLFFYRHVVCVTAFQALGPERGSVFRAAFTRLLAADLVRTLFSDTPAGAVAQLTDTAAADMDAYELEMAQLRLQPGDYLQTSVWNAAKRISSAGGQPDGVLIAGPCSTILSRGLMAINPRAAFTVLASGQSP